MSTTKDVFRDLYHARFNHRTKADWDAYYDEMSAFLDDPDPKTRAGCLERLATAAFWAEGSGPRKERPPLEQTHNRTKWLLDVFLQTHEKHSDTLPVVLDIMRHKFPGRGHHDLGMEWLRALAAHPPEGVRPDLIQGTIVLHEAFEEGHEQATLQTWITLLDDPSDYVRACAAYRIGGVSDEGPLSQSDLFAFIKQKDIQRPGIAGAFWTDGQYSLDGQDDFAMEWMMDILEARTTPVPTDAPFNDIEFHLHEICDHSPDMVRRMLAGGHKGLAIETALETRGVVDGMAPVLRDLAWDDDAQVAQIMARHLAYYYQEVHPNAAEGSIKRLPRWHDRADLFFLRFFPDAARFDCAVIYCTSPDQPFSDAQGWALIDQILPAEKRGFLRSGVLAFDKFLPPKPEILGDKCSYYYENHSSVSFQGDPSTKRWSRIVIHSRTEPLADVPAVMAQSAPW